MATRNAGAMFFEEAAAMGMPKRQAMTVPSTAIWKVSTREGKMAGRMEKSGGQKRERKRPRFAA